MMGKHHSLYSFNSFPVNEFMQALLSLDRLSAKRLMLDQSHGISPIPFIEEVVAVALERIGVGWQEVEADTMCRTASEAVVAIHKVMGGVS